MPVFPDTIRSAGAKVALLARSEEFAPAQPFVAPAPSSVAEVQPARTPAAASLQPPRRNLLELPDDVIHGVLQHLSHEALQDARSACKELARVGLEPSLPGWQSSFDVAMRRARGPKQVLTLIESAARRGVLQHLTRLDLGGKGLLARDLQTICDLVAALPRNRLECLDVSLNTLGPAGIRVLAEATHLRLRELNLRLTKLDGAALRELLQVEHLAGLKRLNVSWNRLQLAGGEALGGACGLTRLHELDTNHAELGDAGVRALLAKNHLGSLRELHLRGNQLSGEAAWALAEATYLIGLETLDLSGNSMGVPATVQALATAQHLRTLRSLNLHTNDWRRGEARFPRLTDRMLAIPHFRHIPGKL